jgi:hypothetical protein
MRLNFEQTLIKAGWFIAPGYMDGAGWHSRYWTHDDSPDSEIRGDRSRWTHVAWGGPDVDGKVVIGTGRSLKALRKHLGYFHRSLEMKGGS